MRHLFVTLFLPLLLLMAVSCTEQERADLVIVNGKVLTIDPDNPYAEAIAISGDRIVAVGSLTAINRFIDKDSTEVIDAEGNLVIPGFNDAHAHFGPVNPDYIELRYITDPAIITTKVREQVAKSKPGELIRGGHWEHEMFTDRNWPTPPARPTEDTARRRLPLLQSAPRASRCRSHRARARSPARRRHS